MESIQINGQKIWGPPKDWTGPPPPHGTEVFVKNVPDDAYENELYDLFSKIGKIYEVRLPVHWTGINKGYAFVRYTKITEADIAIIKLNQWFIRSNRQLRVERSLDNTRLYLSRVPNDKTEEELKSDLSTVVENVKTVYVYPALDNPTTFRGYAFVEFVCHRDAAIAKRILTPDVLFNLFERKCIAAWAKPLPFLSKEDLINTNTIFMRNISNNVKNNSIRIAVDSLICPDRVHKFKRLNYFAFLTFENHEIAERAMNKIIENPFLLGMKAVQVEWAIPRVLGNSFSAKGFDLGQDDESELDFGSNIGHRQNPLCILDNNKMNQSKFLIANNINKNYVNVNNIENNPITNTASVKILQRQNENFERFSNLDKTRILTNITNIMSEIQTYSNPNNTNKLDHFSKFVPDEKINTQKQGLITEFCPPNSETYYRNMHLKNWLQSLAMADQSASCISSPSLTSPSTDSSTNMNWTWDEGYSQFSLSRNSVGV